MKRTTGIIRAIEWILLAIVFLVPVFVTKQFVFPFIGEKTFLFYILVEVACGLWVYVALQKKEYRPRFHPILISGGLFLAVYTLAGIVGVNPEISFWSNMSRMSGLILLFHVCAFVLLLVTIVKDQRTWTKVLSAFVFGGLIVAVVDHIYSFSSASYANTSLIGNSSFLGTYLLLSIFIALLLTVRSSGRMRIVFAISCVVMGLTSTLSTLLGLPHLFSDPFGMLGVARAASVSLLVGVVFSILIYFSLVGKHRFIKVGTSVLLVFMTVSVLAGSILVLVPNSSVRDLLAEQEVGSRYPFWDSALSGIQERPFLGYGPENYFVPFYSYFKPELLTEEYKSGIEADADKPHNMYLEIAVTGGLLSLALYLGIFASAFFALWQGVRKKLFQSSETALLTGLLIAYLLQNLFLFDTLTSYLGVGVILAYIVSVSSGSLQGGHVPLSRQVFWGRVAIIGVVFSVILYLVVYAPFMQQAELIDLTENMTVQERSRSYEELFARSPHSRTPMMTYLMIKMSQAVPVAFEGMSLEERKLVLADVQALREAVTPYIGDAPTHYRLVLAFARLHFVEATLELEVGKQEMLLEEVKKYQSHLERLSPTNPQNEWVEAQRQLFMGDAEGAAATLEESLRQTPHIPGTEELLGQTNTYIIEKDNVPFFSY